MFPVSTARSLLSMVAMFIATYLFRRSTEVSHVEVVAYQPPPIDLVQWAKEWVAQHHGVAMEAVESTYPLTMCDRLKFWEDASEFFEIDRCGFEDISGGFLCIDVYRLREALRAKGKQMSPICWG